MTIHYLFRKPRFPIFCDFEGALIAARTGSEFQRRLGKVEIKPEIQYPIVDSTGNEWRFFPDKMYITPWIGRKWSKKKIIQTYNQSRNCARIGETYSEKSLSSKRFEVVFADIVGLIERSQ